MISAHSSSDYSGAQLAGVSSPARRHRKEHADLTIASPRFAGPDGPAANDRVIRAVVLALLAVDGVLCALAAALLLPLYIGAVPFPISALVAGLVNMALVWAAMTWTTSNRLAALPLWTWLLTVAVLTFGGPGGDVVFNGPGVNAYRVLLLIVVGTGPPAWLLSRRGHPSQVPTRRPR